jgi:hypothetical protein
VCGTVKGRVRDFATRGVLGASEPGKPVRPESTVLYVESGPSSAAHQPFYVGAFFRIAARRHSKFDNPLRQSSIQVEKVLVPVTE